MAELKVVTEIGAADKRAGRAAMSGLLKENVVHGCGHRRRDNHPACRRDGHCACFFVELGGKINPRLVSADIEIVPDRAGIEGEVRSSPIVLHLRRDAGSNLFEWSGMRI